MTNHPTQAVVGITNADLARRIASLRYDALAEFLMALNAALDADSNADYERGRPRLAKFLYWASMKIGTASGYINQAWEICEPRLAPNPVSPLPISIEEPE